MSIFEDITLKWQGQQAVIPANRVMMAIARVEEVTTLDELAKFAQRGTAPLARLAMAYGALLRYAGIKVQDEEVFQSLFGDGQGVVSTASSINTLLTMMIPPSVRKGGSDVKPGKPQKAKGSNSSKKPTRPLSPAPVS